MTQAKKAAPKTASEREMAVIFPHVDVQLTSGEKIAVKQWSIDQGAVLLPRVIAMMEKLEGLRGEVELPILVQRAKPECLQIVAETIGWSVEDLNTRATFEDFLGLLQAVIDTSLIRKEGGGALPKLAGVVSALRPLAAIAAQT